MLNRFQKKSNVKQALRRVELNNGAPGIDGMQVEDKP